MKHKIFKSLTLFAVSVFSALNLSAATQYCETPQGHLNNPDFGDPSACVKLSITKSSQEGFVDVKVAMNRDKSTTSKIDYVYVEHKGLPYTAGTDDNGDAFDELTAQVNVGSDESGALMIQYSNPNWDGRWQIDLTDVDFTATCAPQEITSEYCNYEGNETKSGNTYVALSWETDADGNVVITMANGTGATSCAFRNGGFEGGIDAFVVSTDNFVTTTPASDYFTFTKVYSGNTAMLVKIADLPANAKIKHIGDGHAFAWKVNNGDAWGFPDFIYTYGSVCPSDYPVTGVTLNTATRTIEVGTTYTLTATVAPDYATNKNVTWSSSAGGVATVANGVVTPVSAGTTTITVTTEDGGFTATCEVTVIEKTSQCYGDLGHFATPANARMHYEIVYEDSKATFTITGLYAPLDYGEVQIVDKGNFGMTADGNGGYYYTFNNVNAGDKLYFRFLYSDTSMLGNEMTSEGLSTSDPNIRYYIMGDCPPPYKKTAEDYTKLAGVTAMSETTRDVSDPAFGIDNDENTFWESQWNMQPQEYTIDLGKECIFNTVIVKFGDHRAGEYDILVSRDGENFKTIATDQAGVNNADASTGVGLTQARFVRLKLKSRPNGYGFDIKNVKVLFVEDSELTTLAISNADNFFKVGQNYTITVDARDQYGVTMDPGTVTYTVSPTSMGSVVNNVFIPAARGVVEITANVGDIVSNTISKHIVSGDNLALNNAMQEGGDWVGTYYNTDTPDKAVNGDAGDVWQGSVNNGNDPVTGLNYDAWFVVDLQGAYDIDLITIKFEGACSDAYHIDFSADATNWTTVYSFAKTMGTNAHTDYITSFSESTARYIRFWSTKAATGWGMKVHELQVFGSEATSTTKSVGVSVNDAAMGSATVKQDGVDVTEAEVGSTVVFNAVANEGYEFLNWTKGGVEVSIEATYEVMIEGNTSLQANFDKIYTQYCHTAITSTTGGNKKLYLTLSQVGDSIQILYEGSSECQLLGLNNVNFQINNVCTNIEAIDPVSGKPVNACGQDVPFSIDYGRVRFSAEGFGSAKMVFALAEGKTWKDIYVWTHAIYFSTVSGEVGYTDFPDRYDIAWNKSCSDTEAPVMDAPQAEALNATTIRLTLNAIDNWDGDITYIISREGVDDVTTTSPSGVATTVDITGLTTGTEYTFSVVAEDEFGYACEAQECKATPAGDIIAPSNVSISAVAVTDKIVRLTMYADDNVPGQLLYNIAWANGGHAQTSAERGTEVVYELTGLTPATEYTFTLTVKDAADNWSAAVNSNAVTTFSGNLALNKPATAGYAALPVNEGNDGNKASRWGSGNNDSHPANDWWSVDLGAVYDLSNIRIMWENARPKFYDILVSNDGTNWTVAQSYDQLPSSSADASAIEDYAIVATGRYIKVAATATAGGYDNLNWGISFWELEAYGTLAVDTEKPVITTFTAIGVSSTSVQLKAQATDNFCGQLTYTFYCEGEEKGSVNQAYGEDASFTVTGLTMGTTYNFSVIATDAAENVSDAAYAQAQPVTDTEAPQNVTVTAGEITFASIQLLLNATDNLGGDITYTISRAGAEDVVATGASGVEKAVVIADLDYDTEYTFSVVAKDGSDNAAAAIQCTATTEKAKFPVTTAPVPTRPADDVIAIYSDVYTTKVWGHNENWGQTTQLQDMQIDGDNFLYYTNLNWLGWQCGQGVEDASAMKGLHVDIWADQDGSIGIVPIYGVAGPTDDTHRKIVNVIGKQWNSFDLDLATDFAGLDVSSIFQFKFDNAVGTIFAIDNLYFFIDPDHVRDNQTIDGLGTVCLPFEVAPAYRKGAAFYRISHNNGGFIHFIEETGTLEAGRAYIFQAEAEQVRFYKANDAEEVDAVVIDDESRGLIGTLEDITPGNLTGKYVIANDYKIHICGSGAYLNANRAYMDLEAIPSTPLEINDPEGAPVRRTLSFGGAPRDVVTNLETLDATAMPDGTYIINNQLVIFRDGKRYNVVGQRVK